MRDETITRELETIIINQLLLWISDKINLYVYSERFKINSSFTYFHTDNTSPIPFIPVTWNRRLTQINPDAYLARIFDKNPVLKQKGRENASNRLLQQFP